MCFLSAGNPDIVYVFKAGAVIKKKNNNNVYIYVVVKH